MIIEKVEKRKGIIKASEIMFDSEIYARFDPNQALITEYESNIDQIMAGEKLVEVAADYTLIDGYHRWKAFQRVYGVDAEMQILIHETTNRDYIELASYASNTKHGLRTSAEENRRNIQRLYFKGFNIEQIMEALGLSKTVVFAATERQRKQEKEEQEKMILDMYLHAQYTQEMIAEIFGVTQQAVSKILTKNSARGESCKDFSPPLYNIWSLQKQDNSTTSHFGSFPLYFMKSLLYYHTEPWDIVFDPFAGGGTTVDACKEMLRRYYCTDRIVKPGREKDIQQHDIKDGLPNGMPKPHMVFLDPPYWKQAEGAYSDSPDDLGNMDLQKFYSSIEHLLDEIKIKKTNKVAFVIQPTQYKNNLAWEDHIFKINTMLSDTYDIEARYILPYSTQQYNAQMVEVAKDKKICLSLYRDLAVWRRRLK
jgi:transposase